MNRLRSARPSASLVFASTGLLVVSLCASKAFASAPTFPPPPGATIQVVSESIKSSGMTLSIRRFETPDTIEDVGNFYKKRWARGKDDQPGYREALSPPWYILSHLDGRHLLAVQIQPAADGGSWGYLSVSDLPEVLDKGGSKKAPMSNFPSMAGSVVLDETDSVDPGKTARVLSIVNDYSATGNVSFYRDHYREQGWRTDADLKYYDGHTLTFSNRGKQVRIVVHPLTTGGSSIVVNEVEASRF